MNTYEKLAKAIGTVGGQPVTEQDVRTEMRSKSYSRNVGRDGLLPPGEIARLAKHVRHRVAQRLVEEESEKNREAFEAQQRKARAAQAKRSVVQKPQPAQTDDKAIALAQWKRRHRIGIIVACGTADNSNPVAKAAWEEYSRGPGWLR
jgi:7-keto-8-aminopelargonate synthetase-like enzyme